MVTIDNVISIDGYTEFSGSQEIDPAGIVYARPYPDDATKTLLYEEQFASFKQRTWLIGETVTNIIANVNGDAGYDVLVEGTLVSFMLDTEFAGETWTTNPARIFQMRESATGNNAIIRLNSYNVQGLLEFEFDRTPAAYATDANTSITQVESGLVNKINENELPESVTIYWSTRLVQKDIPARTGFGDNSTPQVIHVATSESKIIEYSIDANTSS
jgi:hypothetical protein